MPKPTEPPAEPIRISDNTILDGKFYTAGAVLPVARIEDLPEPLRPLVVTGEAEEPPDDQPRGDFQLNTPYHVTSEGRLGRQVQRQIAQMQAEEDEKDWIEWEAERPLPPEVARDLQDAHESDVAGQAAQAAYAARAAADISDAIAADAEPPALFVKRGGRHYAPAHKARLQPGEDVFVRQPDGSFEFIGITDNKAELPDLPIIMP